MMKRIIRFILRWLRGESKSTDYRDSYVQKLIETYNKNTPLQDSIEQLKLLETEAVDKENDCAVKPKAKKRYIPATPEQYLLLDIVSKASGFPNELIRSKRRFIKLTIARQVISYIGRIVLKCNPDQCADILQMDRTTIPGHIRAIEDLRVMTNEESRYYNVLVSRIIGEYINAGADETAKNISFRMGHINDRM